jgi:hypothetical protein
MLNRARILPGSCDRKCVGCLLNRLLRRALAKMHKIRYGIYSGMRWRICRVRCSVLQTCPSKRVPSFEIYCFHCCSSLIMTGKKGLFTRRRKGESYHIPSLQRSQTANEGLKSREEQRGKGAVFMVEKAAWCSCTRVFDRQPLNPGYPAGQTTSTEIIRTQRHLKLAY